MEHRSQYDIELANINHTDEEHLLPTQDAIKHHHLEEEGEDDDDDEDEDPGDEGNRALLGSEERTRGRERLQLGRVGTLWPQVKNIVIEVRGVML